MDELPARGTRRPDAEPAAPARRDAAPERRTQLLERARADGMLVLEDDYDGEFRYDGRPIAALQSLEPALVIYAGTAAKTLAPGLRLGWLVLPERAVAPTSSPRRSLDRADRRPRPARVRGAAPAPAATTATSARCGSGTGGAATISSPCSPPAFPGSEIAGAAAGLNLLLRLPDEASEQRALAATQARGVAVQGLADGGYYEGPPEHGLIVGYAATQEHAYAAAVEALVAALGKAGRREHAPVGEDRHRLVAAEPRGPAPGPCMPIANAAVAYASAVARSGPVIVTERTPGGGRRVCGSRTWSPRA